MNDDLISRSAALALAKDICVVCEDGTAYRHRCIDPQSLMELPAVQPDVMAKYEMLKEHCDILERANEQLRKTIVYMVVKRMEADVE